MNTTRYSATVEYLPGHRAAIIELTDSLGEWAGGFRVDLARSLPTGRTSLYEEGFRAAERAAAVKGGVLDRFSEFSEPEEQCAFCGQAFRRCRCAPVPTPASCGQAASVVQLRRPGNGLNVEHFVNSPDRCRLKMPEHWFGSGRSSLRWIGSGGSPVVFGPCTPNACPK